MGEERTRVNSISVRTRFKERVKVLGECGAIARRMNVRGSPNRGRLPANLRNASCAGAEPTHTYVLPGGHAGGVLVRKGPDDKRERALTAARACARRFLGAARRKSLRRQPRGLFARELRPHGFGRSGPRQLVPITAHVSVPRMRESRFSVGWTHAANHY